MRWWRLHIGENDSASNVYAKRGAYMANDFRYMMVGRNRPVCPQIAALFLFNGAHAAELSLA
jgi:hypothetical protein